MDAYQLRELALAAGIEPLLVVEETTGSGSLVLIEKEDMSRHRLTEPAVMAGFCAEGESWEAGTHDGIRDGAGSHISRAPHREYYSVAALAAAGIIHGAR